MIQQIYPVAAHDYRYELNKDMQFAAAHYIPAEEAGACSRVHGHTYFANLTVVGDDLDECGFLVNFSILKKLVHDRFDHRVLNEDKELFNDVDSNRFPSTEIVARSIYELVQQYLDSLPNHPRCLQVFLRETPTSYVIYRPQREVRQDG